MTVPGNSCACTVVVTVNDATTSQIRRNPLRNMVSRIAYAAPGVMAKVEEA